MTQAYNTYYASQLTTVPVTDLYVKFSPLNEAQLVLLEDSLDLDLYDYPLDYEVVTDGDYYPQPGKAAEDMPDFYTTVPVSFTFPAGVPYTILEELHFPHNDVILEALAESIAAGGHYSGVLLNAAQQGQQQTYGSDARPVLMTNLDNGAQLINTNGYGCEPNPFDLQCIPPDPTCGGGGDPGWGGGGNPGPPSFPPGFVTPPQNRPSGHINLFDTQLGNVPLHNVRVIAKRGFIRTMGYTNVSGHFITARAVTGSSKLILRYRNADVSVRPLRTRQRLRLSLLVVRQVMGRYNLPLNNIQFTVTRNNNRTSKSFENWLAAHAIYSYNYFAQQAQLDGMKRMTGHRLCIYLQKHSDEDNRGPEADLTLQNYIFKNRGVGEWILESRKLILYLLDKNYPSAVLLILENSISSQKPDIILKYNTMFENLSSNEISKEFVAAFALCGQFKSISDNHLNPLNLRWKSYFKIKDKWLDIEVGVAGAIIKQKFLDFKLLKKNPEFNINLTNSKPFKIRGNQVGISTVFSMVSSVKAIARHQLLRPHFEFYDMVNGIAQFYGHFLMARRYGHLADAILGQKRQSINSFGFTSSHEIYLENWDPGVEIDLNLEQRVGLFYDLYDNSSSEIVPGSLIDDNVAGVLPREMQKGISGYPPRAFSAPFLWLHLRNNIKLRYPLIDMNINSLFEAYNIL